MKTFTLFIALLMSSTALAGSVEHELIVDPAGLELVSTVRGTRAQLPGHSTSARPGQPALPVRDVHLALPPMADPATVRIEVEDLASPVEIPLRGRSLAPAPRLRVLCPCSGSGVVDVGTTVEAWSTGRLGAVSVFSFLHRPVELDASRDVLVVRPRQRLRVTFQEHKRAADRPARASDVGRASDFVENPAGLAAWYPVLRDEQPPGLAVVTTDWFLAESQALDDFVAAHEEQGYVVTVVTESDFGSLDGPAPNQLPQKLRAWLQENRDPLGLDHAVLIGNPDPFYGDLPMLAARPFGPDNWEWGTETPTDAYYADLTGDWNLDGDELYGEYEDDGGPGGVDFFPELHVGRIPVYGNAEVADRLLARTSTYLRARRNTDWRRRILFPGSIIFFEDLHDPYSAHMEGGDIAEFMKPEFLGAGFDVTTMYEREGVQKTIYPCDLSLTAEELIREWNRGYGLVYWFGHGSEDGAFRTIWPEDEDGNGNPDPWEQASVPYMQSIWYNQLPVDTPAILIHGSCSNGTPETASNLGYTLLKTGSIASYSSTRVALGSGEPDWQPDLSNADLFTVGYYVMQKIRQGKTTGEAIGQTRSLIGTGYFGAYAWHTKFATSLYGAPTITVSNCRADSDCDDANPCNGVETCVADICHDGEPVDCADLDSDCARGDCDEATGACVALPLDGEPCDDGLFCTVADRCKDGTCGGTPRTCEAEAGPCIEGICDEDALACSTTRLPDGQACTLGSIEGACRSGVCEEEDTGCSSSGTSPGSGAWLLLLLFLPFARRRR